MHPHLNAVGGGEARASLTCSLLSWEAPVKMEIVKSDGDGCRFCEGSLQSHLLAEA